ncbi:soluble lytic murein transglycosylase [Luteimonas sp. J16]|uniref:lytic transglycosylase domain-containing protein n=1 Tax=unclassified Luteimonas TaxID=2629088 RepID=UPI00047C4EA1|nr:MULTISPECIES: lytic transglycosylase domain-containing protein [unclassified Luteimonas]TWG89396.1 soluble lytic murein transglycosylase [Luteimonas sp. J16]
MWKQPRIVLAALALLAAPLLRAQDDATLRAAFEAAERGLPPPALPADHPVRPWVEMATLRKDIDTLPAARAQDFLKRHAGQPVAEAFREAWLRSLLKRKDWTTFRAAWSPAIKDTTLRCGDLQARLAAGAADAQWTADAQAIWRSSGKSLPDACDPVFDALAARGGLTDALRWERIELAAAEWEPGVMRAAARGLPAEQLALANDYAAFVQAPHPRATQWPKTARSRLVASHGLAKLAKDDPLAAEAQLPAIAQALDFTEAERGRVLYQAALWTVASYLPDSARLLALVPDSAYDERLHEWRVREALSRGDWKAALDALRRMDPKQRDSSRWTWFEARMLELTGDREGARALFARAASRPDFHGFLAADRLDRPYALCPLMPDWSDAEKAAVAADPALVRAMALFRADRSGWATREWNDALTRLDDRQRRIAVQVAQEHGWFDRAVFNLGKVPEEQRLYTLRFPIHHADLIEREARRNGLDPAWVAAEIRAESTFNPRARSPANARGLMQVLPSTGAAVARRLGLPWGGAESLYDPATNITLGTAYLREKEAMYGKPYVAIAAYNAGPTPTSRWLSQRGHMDPDIWIETISYRETREYVARVLAFSVLYDWRMFGTARPVSERMLGAAAGNGKRKRFECPAPDAAPQAG